jgi:hypothetical protein
LAVTQILALRRRAFGLCHDWNFAVEAWLGALIYINAVRTRTDYKLGQRTSLVRPLAGLFSPSRSPRRETVPSIVFDNETCGLSTTFDQIFQFAAILADSQTMACVPRL